MGSSVGREMSEGVVSDVPVVSDEEPEELEPVPEM